LFWKSSRKTILCFNVDPKSQTPGFLDFGEHQFVENLNISSSASQFSSGSPGRANSRRTSMRCVVAQNRVLLVEYIKQDASNTENHDGTYWNL